MYHPVLTKYYTATYLSIWLSTLTGLGMSFDIVSLDAPGATGSYDSNFASKAAVAANALVNEGLDFCLVHVKAVDDTGHDRMLAMKVGLFIASHCVSF